MELAVIIAGVGQLGVALGSLAVPFVLGWREDLRSLQTLTRQVFWTYAGYIWATNVSFGLLSVLAPKSLLDGSTLATAVSGFIALYWLARIIIQFTYFDRSSAPKGIMPAIGEIALVGSFLLFTGVYGLVTYQSIVG